VLILQEIHSKLQHFNTSTQTIIKTRSSLGLCDRSFELLKKKLVESPVLATFDQEKPIEVHVDASKVGLGALLMQKHGKHLRPIAYASRTINKNELEGLGVIWSLEKFRPYLFLQNVKVVTDHICLGQILDMKRQPKSGRLSRW
jgi:hypothetical protein